MNEKTRFTAIIILFLPPTIFIDLYQNLMYGSSPYYYGKIVLAVIWIWQVIKRLVNGRYMVYKTSNDILENYMDGNKERYKNRKIYLKIRKYKWYVIYNLIFISEWLLYFGEKKKNGPSFFGWYGIVILLLLYIVQVIELTLDPFYLISLQADDIAFDTIVSEEIDMNIYENIGTLTQEEKQQRRNKLRENVSNVVSDLFEKYLQL
jgi:hypothetical protein